jgi:hypothetical protein
MREEGMNFKTLFLLANHLIVVTDCIPYLALRTRLRFLRSL